MTRKEQALTEQVMDLQARLQIVESELRYERTVSARIRGEHAELVTASHKLDLLYQDVNSQLATVRLALEAPNPCDLVQWAMRVKKQAGRMADDIESQVAGLRA